MKALIMNAMDKVSHHVQMGLYTLLLAGGMALPSNAQSNDAANSSLTMAQFKQNTVSMVGDKKDQHIKWSQICNTDNIDNVNFKEEVEQALSNIENSQTGQVLFKKIQDNFSHRRLFDKDIGNDEKKIFMMDQGARGTGGFNTTYLMPTADDYKSIYGAYITLNPEEMRNIGYFSNGELFPFSLEQVIVHEMGHAAHDTESVIRREYNQDGFEEHHADLECRSKYLSKDDTDGNVLLGFLSERGKLLDDIRDGRAADIALRQQIIEDINHYTDSINSVVTQSHNPAIHEFVTNMNDVEAIVGEKERHAIDYENSYLLEQGFPLRTEYGEGMNLIMPTQSDSILHVGEMTPSTTTGQAPLIGIGVL